MAHKHIIVRWTSMRAPGKKRHSFENLACARTQAASLSFMAQGSGVLHTPYFQLVPISIKWPHLFLLKS